MMGAIHHNSRNGAATLMSVGLNRSTKAPATITIVDERPKGRSRFVSAWVAPLLACSAVTHFSN